MQVLDEPVDGSALGALETLLLSRVLGVAADSEAVGKSREVLVVVFNAQGGDGLVAVLLELGSEHGVGLWREDLDGHGDLQDLLLGEKRGVSGGDAVNEALVLGSTELEDGPATYFEYPSDNWSQRIITKTELVSLSLFLLHRTYRSRSRWHQSSCIACGEPR